MKHKTDSARYRLALSALLALLLILTAVFARQLCPWDPYAQDYRLSLLPPSLAHPMGTDRYGRDMLSRVIMGSQISILSALALVAAMTVIGTAAGVAGGYLGGAPDALIMRLCDICLAFPGLVFAMAIAAVLNGGIHNAVLALTAVGWPKYARLARSQTLSVKNSDFIAASRLAGTSSWKIVLRHILPNIFGPVLVMAMLDVGTMIAELAGLSFLGLGAVLPQPEWGSMMSSSRSMLQTSPWVILSPGLAIFITVVVFNFLGDSLQEYLNPRKRPRS